MYFLTSIYLRPPVFVTYFWRKMKPENVNAEYRKQETGNRKQKRKNRKQETGNGNRKHTHIEHKTEYRKQEAGNVKTGNRKQET